MESERPFLLGQIASSADRSAGRTEGGGDQVGDAEFHHGSVRRKDGSFSWFQYEIY